LNQKICNVTVLASGRGSNFEALAKACKNPDYPAKIVGLITDKPRAGALETAESYGIPTFIVPVTEKKGRLPEASEEEIARICRELKTDLIALAGFMRILKIPLLRDFPNRILNIHPALLPSFKGLHAQRQALEYGVKIAGVTVHFVDDSIDGGAIILQSAVPVRDDDDEDSLSKRILAEEHRIYAEAVEFFARGQLKIEGRRVKITPTES
jgi:phosphoribosylglycinamide formyltransferase-1